MIKLKEIKSISIDMSTEEAPYNRIYARPIEKQGDVLLCEFESANYDINKKGKDFTTGISEEMYLDQLKVKENMIKSYQEENTELKDLLKDCYSANQAFIKTFEWLDTIITPTQKDICHKTAEGIKELQSEIDEVLK